MIWKHSSPAIRTYSNPNVLGGTPVFSGTRVPIDSLFDYLKHGRTVDYFLEQFQTVRRVQIEKLLDEKQVTHIR
jgi:uncharacterized protein (DUF433 family)